MVSAQPAASAGQKPAPWRSSSGISRNIGSVGSTYQKVDCASAATRWVSPASCHSQTSASREVSGSETMSAPSAGERRAVSLAAATMTPEMAALIVS